MSKRAEERRANLAAAKQRRQKVIAIAGVAILGILLVIQGPKMLDAFGGSDSSATAARVTPVVVPPEGKPPLRALRFNGSATDPFAVRSLADNDPKAGAVSGPNGAKDPFALKGGGSSLPTWAGSEPKTAPQPLPKQIVIGTPTPTGKARRGWIVVIASIQTRVGRRYAEQFAARVRLNGLAPVSVLDSSTRKPLRSGYFVVYTGPFATLNDVQRSAAHVRAFGYRTAYIREILQY